MARDRKAPRQEWALAEADFRRRLAADDPYPIYVVVGPERFLAAEAVAAIRDRVLPAGAPEASYLRVEGPAQKQAVGRFDAGMFMSDLLSASLFAPHKLVVLDPAELVMDAHRDLLARYVESPSAFTTLVLVAETVDGRTTLGRRLRESRVLAANCRALYDRPAPWERGRVPEHASELSQWIVRRAKEKHQRRIDLQVAHLLHSLAGKELGVLAGALERLSMQLAAGVPITAAVVRQAIAPASGQSAFELSEAVQDRAVEESLTIFRRIQNAGLDLGSGRVEREPARAAPMILGALRSSLLRMWRALAATADGMTPRQALEGSGLHPVFLDRAVGQLARWNDRELKAALVGLARLEEASKTGRLYSFAAEVELWLIAAAGRR